MFYWETSNGRKFDVNEYNIWFNNHMLYESEIDDETDINDNEYEE
jgi:hypothetical protein